jgi:hypothetical protein
MARNKVAAKPAAALEPAVEMPPPNPGEPPVEHDPLRDGLPIPETPDGVNPFDMPLGDFLAQLGVPRENIEAKFAEWATSHSGIAPLAQVALNFVAEELNQGVFDMAKSRIAIGLTKVFFEGKGPVAHSGCELV